MKREKEKESKKIISLALLKNSKKNNVSETGSSNKKRKPVTERFWEAF